VSDPIVRIDGLVKRYDGRTAVDGIDLTVRRGEILALLGPNGAGKTTTVETVEGYRTPDSGTVRVFGLDPRRHGPRIKPRVGLMLQRTELYSQIRVLEAVTLFAAFYPLPLEPHTLLQQVGLDGLAGRRYRTLSGGERQRLNLALALVGRPELAVLDEPTASMDVAARHETWNLLRELRERGASILLTTHLLEEAEALADRIAILDRGRLVALGTAREIGAAAGGSAGRRTVRLELEEPLDRSAEGRLAALAGVDGFRVVRPGIYSLATVVPSHVIVEVATLLRDVRREPLGITVGGSSLEEAFLRLTAEGAGDSGRDRTET
jgi:ABC-2 type transport system ATP-binding protein